MTIWQFWCKNELTPKFTDKFVWSVKIKSMQEDLFAKICVGSLINWKKPFEDANESNFESSLVWIPFVHHRGDLALKPPVITAKDGLHLLIFDDFCLVNDKL